MSSWSLALPGATTDPARLALSYQRAEQVTAHWARSFYFASRFLPLPKRRAIFALYDFCRYADNLVDERGERTAADVRRDLARLGQIIGSIHSGTSAPARWLALQDTLQRYPVPLTPFLELLEGVTGDLGPVRIRDFPALREYCRKVAGGVGLMLGPVLGASRDGLEEFGVKLGIAMQLTNVVRDVGEDYAMGRIYLPASELHQFGVTEHDLELRRVTPGFQRLMQFQVARAREYFAAGDHVIELFPRDGSRLTVRLLQQTYAGILDRIEHLQFDVFRTRAYVSFPRKLAILGRAVLE